MSLVAYGTAASTDAPELANNGFWPDLDPDDFREQHRLDTTVTQPRLVTALSIAMASVNRQLADFQTEQVAAQRGTADLIPIEPWQIPGHHALLYVRAVFAEAHAQLLERYRDHSATDVGDERGEAKVDAAEDYRRDARWAVAEIVGRNHTTVELI
ncbi:Phage head completion protein (GPL) [Modicisalibacter ilicicola DSM 19980]|uniref:Phage head completion protein (GPL) n=1 Tax=Modicisalibacter ilicicola DSM 19980 TaxID=1121942 RepID=A0A1M4Y4C7_9GAMM|nr:head completion/stabilization protein [Halomonas ilicicola]SHF00611.1 Phage head completion protein (GPL) [Halomonas ilicicola DSM 19980]